MAWYSRLQLPTQHIIGHFEDDVAGQITQPTEDAQTSKIKA